MAMFDDFDPTPPLPLEFVASLNKKIADSRRACTYPFCVCLLFQQNSIDTGLGT